MIANKVQGEVRVFGSPAEEGGSGKVYLVRAGLFKDVSAVLHWTPLTPTAYPSARAWPTSRANSASTV